MEMMMMMIKAIVLASIVLIATVSMSIALVDRMKERDSQDRLSLGDESTTVPLAR